ncbi:hypothetical protein, partial [Escherichia coli]|uniref:hypothetical protein n=2 Tax=Escherichia coli TaxID=562 RepID=UPI001FF3B66A
SLRLIVFLIAGIRGREKSISATNKKWLFVKKILKVVLRQTITGLTAIEPTGGNPIRNQRLAI